MDSLGSRIKEIRKSQKMTQTDFGNLFGLSPSHISNIENDRENPSATLVLFICSKFNINKEWLTSGIGGMHPNFGINSDTENYARYNSLKSDFEHHLNLISGKELQLVVDTFAYFCSCVSAHNLTGSEREEYLSHINGLIKTIDILLADANGMNILTNNKPDYKALLSLRSSYDTAVQKSSTQLREAVNVYLKKANIDPFI